MSPLMTPLEPPWRRRIGKVSLAGTLVVSLLIGVALAPSVGVADGDRVVTAMTAEELRELMSDEGYSVTIEPNGVVTWEVQGLQTQVVTADDHGSLLFHAAFNGGNATLRKVNAWNRKERFSRSYLDEDGDPHLELDLDLSGGVTTDRIREFLRTSRTSFDAWCVKVVAAQ
jgi:hypothetical protein